MKQCPDIDRHKTMVGACPICGWDEASQGKILDEVLRDIEAVRQEAGFCPQCGLNLLDCEGHDGAPREGSDVSDEYAWLIEVDEHTGQPLWWTADPRIPWTHDANKAIRFSRRVDAEFVILHRDYQSRMWKDLTPKATEHGWLSKAHTNPATPPAPLGTVDVEAQAATKLELAHKIAENEAATLRRSNTALREALWDCAYVMEHGWISPEGMGRTYDDGWNAACNEYAGSATLEKARALLAQELPHGGKG